MSDGHARGWLQEFHQAGFVVIENVVDKNEVQRLIDATQTWFKLGREGVLSRQGEAYGVRDLLWTSSDIRRLAKSPELMKLVEPILGPSAFPVRGLFFDKTLSTNWNLPWHQDLTIAVRSRRVVSGFGPWTLKAGIPHVHAPAELLGRMVTLRLHLDDCGSDNRPMRVLRGSHLSGKLSPGQVAEWTARAGELSHDCLVPQGGVVLMRPLLLHASATATRGEHRRVIHLEYANETLPEGLTWFDQQTSEAIMV